MRFPIKTVSTIALAWVAGTSGASAHEYWLEPLEFTVPIGQAIQGNLKNGQDFKGSNFSYIPKYFEQFTISGPSGKVDVKGRSGDLPALNQPVEKPGLYSVS